MKQNPKGGRTQRPAAPDRASDRAPERTTALAWIARLDSALCQAPSGASFSDAALRHWRQPTLDLTIYPHQQQEAADDYAPLLELARQSERRARHQLRSHKARAATAPTVPTVKTPEPGDSAARREWWTRRLSRGVTRWKALIESGCNTSLNAALQLAASCAEHDQLLLARQLSELGGERVSRDLGQQWVSDRPQLACDRLLGVGWTEDWDAAFAALTLWRSVKLGRSWTQSTWESPDEGVMPEAARALAWCVAAKYDDAGLRQVISAALPELLEGGSAAHYSAACDAPLLRATEQWLGGAAGQMLSAAGTLQLLRQQTAAPPRHTSEAWRWAWGPAELTLQQRPAPTWRPTGTADPTSTAHPNSAAQGLEQAAHRHYARMPQHPDVVRLWGVSGATREQFSRQLSASERAGQWSPGAQLTGGLPLPRRKGQQPILSWMRRHASSVAWACEFGSAQPQTGQPLPRILRELGYPARWPDASEQSKKAWALVNQRQGGGLLIALMGSAQQARRPQDLIRGLDEDPSVLDQLTQHAAPRNKKSNVAASTEEISNAFGNIAKELKALIQLIGTGLASVPAPTPEDNVPAAAIVQAAPVEIFDFPLWIQAQRTARPELRPESKRHQPEPASTGGPGPLTPQPWSGAAPEAHGSHEAWQELRGWDQGKEQRFKQNVRWKIRWATALTEETLADRALRHDPGWSLAYLSSFGRGAPPMRRGGGEQQDLWLTHTLIRELHSGHGLLPPLGETIFNHLGLPAWWRLGQGTRALLRQIQWEWNAPDIQSEPAAQQEPRKTEAGQEDA